MSAATARVDVREKRRAIQEIPHESLAAPTR
jgi:hypothetical protein